MAKQPIRIGARGSKLSVIQAETVRVAIAMALGDDNAAVLVKIVTSGDRIQDRTLTEIGGKGLFTLEIEQALAEGRIDCAVHSLKDMPTEAPSGLVIAAIPEREDARDAFLSPKFSSLEALPRGARLGTASLRRQAQALRLRPDLEILALRGNVDTRLAKLERGEADAIVLAAAGLNRLGLQDRIRAFIDPLNAPPAPGQGALAIQTRAEDRDAPWLTGLRHRPTALCVAAERAALAVLDGSCRTAIGAFARIDGKRLILTVEALSPDGQQSFRGDAYLLELSDDEGDEDRATELGLRLGAEIKARAGDALSVSP
ncbi:MAG TPA: hydroxymethylbilane synthase [Caulobacteraceae bacterium]